jgi:hypothetical protein
MPDWVDRHLSSDAAGLCANRRIYMTSLGSPTVRVCSTRQSLRKHEFAMDTPDKIVRHPSATKASAQPKVDKEVKSPKPNKLFSDALIDKLHAALSGLTDAEKTRKGLRLIDLAAEVRVSEQTFGHVWHKRVQLDAFQYHILPAYIADKLGIEVLDLLPPVDAILPAPPTGKQSGAPVSKSIEDTFIQECYDFIKGHFDSNNATKTEQTLFDTTRGVLRIIADRGVVLADVNSEIRHKHMRSALDQYLLITHR